MATVTNALENAVAGLRATQARIDTLTRNISNASTDGYSRKVQAQTTTALGTVLVGDVQRVVNDALTSASLQSAGNVGRLTVTTQYLGQIETSLGSPEANSSLAGKMTNLATAFHDLSVSPENQINYISVIDAGADVARSINGMYQTMVDVQEEAKRGINDAVSSINTTLAEIQKVNAAISAGLGNRDTSDLEDQRDRLLKGLAGQLDFTTFKQAGGAIAIYTKDGKTLLDTTARSLDVSNIVAKPSVPANPSEIVVRNGNLGGLLQIREVTVPKLQAQLDDYSRALTVEFANVGIPLFNDAGTVALNPADPVQLSGYGKRIAVNRTIAANPTLIRDGSSATPLDTGDTTFIDQANAIFSKTTVAFTASSGLPANGNLILVAKDFVAGRGADRASSDGSLQYEKTLQQTFETKLSGETGVNVDQEVAQLVVLQQAYAASARVVSTIKDLNDLLMQTGR